jgi:hypothetical protein
MGPIEGTGLLTKLDFNPNTGYKSKQDAAE